MLSSTPITLDAFRRLPRLYRILRPGEHCHPEHAGPMRGDTPLLAVRVGEPVRLLRSITTSSGACR
jgi:hypothetical protein